MTVQSAFEEIHELFPYQTDTAIYRDLDSAQKEFANETKVLTAVGSLSDISTNFAWALPSDCIEVYELRAYDGSYEPVYFGEEQLAWEVDNGRLYIYSLSSTPISAVPSTISYIYIPYKKSPTTVSSSSSTFTLNEKYHKAIVAKVLAEYFAKYPSMSTPSGMIRDWNAVKYWTGIYSHLRIEAKKDANNAKGKSSGEGQQYAFGGKFELPLRDYDSAVSTTTTTALVGLSSIYSKFVIFTIVEGEATGTNLGQYGYTGTISCAIATNVATITSTASDFGAYVDVELSNEDMGWTRTDASNITVGNVGYSGWTRNKIMVYELPV